MADPEFGGFAVNNEVLDFDFPPGNNPRECVCLTCGASYMGRQVNSPAQFHSLEAGHHIFVELQTARILYFPGGNIINPLEGVVISDILQPRFTRENIHMVGGYGCDALNSEDTSWVRPLDVKGHEYVSVTVQYLMRVIPLRNFFLIPENYQHCNSPLVSQFGELTQRYWHQWNCKKELKPHAFLLAVNQASNNRYQMGVESDPIEFLAWLLNSLHSDLKTQNNNDSIILQCFQGELEVVKEIPNKEIGDGTTTDDKADRAAVIVETYRMPFLMLGLDLPMPNPFLDLSMPNPFNGSPVPLSDLLQKFNGEFVTDIVSPRRQKMRYRIIRLPRYLILHMKRFTKHNLFVEKNRTLVEFPLKELDLEFHIPLPEPEKVHSIYDFVAHVIHHRQPGYSGHDETRNDRIYDLYVHHELSSLWVEKLFSADGGRNETHMEFKLVNGRLSALSESSIQIYERQDT